jgi:acetyl-CoA carboxylase beta subunit
MSNTYTFTITVQDEVDGSEPLTEQGAIDYIIYHLEKQSVIEVLNIVRDY